MDVKAESTEKVFVAVVTSRAALALSEGIPRSSWGGV